MSSEPSDSNRIAIIDVGSNSVRLVVFDGLTRAPEAVFNEKVMCGLGRDPKGRGLLNPDGVELALVSLRRFARLLEQMRIAHVDVIATAAVRGAKDGAAFCRRVHRETGLEVRIIDGLEEARLSALGVISGDPGASGVVGDIGGGSLELALLEGGHILERTSLPLGALRLQTAFGRSRERTRKEIGRHLKEIGWLHFAAGKPLYAVGGSWRALAKLHTAQQKYPLSIVHNLTLAREEIERLLRVVAMQTPGSLARSGAIARRRVDSLPHAALVMSQVLSAMDAKSVVFSGHGLREGWMYERLPEKLRRRDPLIDACESFAAGGGRFDEHGTELFRWLSPMFRLETHPFKRLRLAACIIGDVGWAEHPDYRAVQTYYRILRHPFLELTHHDRVLLAFCVACRYDSDFKGDASVNKLLDTEGQALGRRLGLGLRLGQTISGGVEGILRHTELTLAREYLTLTYYGDAARLAGEGVARRLAKLAKAYGRLPRTETG